MKAIESEITLDATRQDVWSTLTDFASYPDWNPFIPRMETEPVEGAPFVAMSRLPNGMKLGFVGRILTVVPEREISWVGRPKMMPASAMEFRHVFTLETVDGGTRLHQREEGTGFMLPISGWILAQAQRGQVALNEALRDRLTN